MSIEENIAIMRRWFEMTDFRGIQESEKYPNMAIRTIGVRSRNRA